MYKHLSFRNLSGIAFLVVVLLLGIGMYMEHIMNLEPCSLCISQRIAFVIVGLFAIGMYLHNPYRFGRLVYAIGISSFSMIGMALAIRQLYIQSLPPDQVSSCLPGITYMFDILPLEKIITAMLSGTGDCAKVAWSLLGISIPGWTLIAFTSSHVLGIYGIIEKR